MVRLEHIVSVAGSFRLEADLAVGPGEYFVVMGPTGSGKTLTMECVAGLRAVASGRILVGGRDVTHAEPRLRGVGYVPQDYALFTTRTVAGNIAFGPRVRRWPREAVLRAVDDAARLTGIAHLLQRQVRGLSGGERQRVALARALAVKPRVLVLDEPVSALDEFTRETLCAELRRVQQELRLTTIHISHNLEEAFSVADRAAVMRAGQVEQVGTVSDLLRRPASEFVARFMRCENVFVAQAEGPAPGGGATRVRVDGVEFLVPGARAGTVRFVVRPESVAVRRPAGVRGAGGEGSVVPVRLSRVVDRGSHVRLELDGPLPLVAHVSPAQCASLAVGEAQPLEAVIRAEDVHVLPGGR